MGDWEDFYEYHNKEQVADNTRGDKDDSREDRDRDDDYEYDNKEPVEKNELWLPFRSTSTSTPPIPLNASSNPCNVTEDDMANWTDAGRSTARALLGVAYYAGPGPSHQLQHERCGKIKVTSYL